METDVYKARGERMSSSARIVGETIGMGKGVTGGCRFVETETRQAHHSHISYDDRQFIVVQAIFF